MKKKILITGAGSAQSNATINCLLMTKCPEEIIGVGADKYDLMFCRAKKLYLIPHAREPDHEKVLLKIIKAEKPSMIHFQHDLEIWKALQFRSKIESLGVKMLVPDFETVDVCVHKYKTWLKLRNAGIPVPNNILIKNKKDLQRAFFELANNKRKIWLRAKSIGNGGKGSLSVSDYHEAEAWIIRHGGWGEFLAAEHLTQKSVTWLSIWLNGRLIVAQGRRRHAWAYSSLSPSGVTGITKICETVSDPIVDAIAIKSIKAITPAPNGIFGVDMTYSSNGVPNTTEINISRFFTTIQFFAEAGLNMPKILKDLVLYGLLPKLKNNINPLPEGLLWLRALDEHPILTTKEKINASFLNINKKSQK
jgi:carbamoyl-phosphate synthase large subunit